MQSSLDLAAFDIHRSELVPEGSLIRVGRLWYAAPLTFWSLKHEARYPMLSRYSPGMIALERDRRR